MLRTSSQVSMALVQDQTLDRWLFTTQHKQLSAEEMDTYDLHTRAAAEADEDFFDNFS